MELKLPNWHWFLGAIPIRGSGNVYTGSMGTNGATGLNDNVFNYRVWPEKEEDALFLVVGCYRGFMSFEATAEEKRMIKRFAPSDEGVKEATEWILELYEKG